MSAVCAALLLTGGAGSAPLLSVEEEIALGREAERPLRAQVPELPDRAVRSYVTRIGRRLAAHAGGPGYPYRFSVANYQELNAFALPGGPVWIH